MAGSVIFQRNTANRNGFHVFRCTVLLLLLFTAAVAVEFADEDASFDFIFPCEAMVVADADAATLSVMSS